MQTAGSGLSATFDADFKERFDDGIQKQYSDWNPLTAWMKESGQIKKKKLGGKYWTFYAEMHAGSNGAAVGENGTIPTSDNPSGVQGNIDYARGFKGQFEISAEAMEYGKGNANVFANVMKQSARACKYTVERLSGPAFWADGSGILAQLAGSAAAGGTANVTLQATEDYNTCRPGSRWLHVGQRLDAFTSAASRTASASEAGCSIASTTRISKILSDTSITLSAASSIATAGVLTNHGELSSGQQFSAYPGPMGLLGLLSSDFMENACGIHATTYSQWDCVRAHNSGTARPQTTSLLYNAWWKAGRNVGSVKHKPVAWTCPDVYSDMLRLFEPNVTYKPTEFKFGFKPMALMINGVNIEVRLDYYAPKYWFLLDPKALLFVNSRPIGLWPDNQKVFEQVSNKTNLRLKYWWGCNMGILKRNSSALISDLDVDTIQL
jgi:hypothetical protein